MMIDLRGANALFYSWVIKDAQGNIVREQKRTLAHSFVVAYLRHMYQRMVLPGQLSFQDTANAARTLNMDTRMDCTATATTSTRGLVVGTGTNAVAIADYALQTQIAHGTGAGQLSYGASVVNLPAADATGTSLILTRDFSNSSGGTITIREIAIYGNNSTFNFCLARDVVTISLTDGLQLTLNYEHRTLI